MNIKYFLRGVVVAFFFVSCNKNNDPNSGNPSGKSLKVKMVVEEIHGASFNTADTTFYSYDNDGRVTIMIEANIKTTYIYNGNANYIEDVFKNDSLLMHEIFYIKGTHADSLLRYNGNHDTTTEKFAYNGDLLISETLFVYSTAGGSIPSSKLLFTWDNNSDLIKQEQDDAAGQIVNTITFTYLHNQPQNATGPNYFSNMSKDLPAAFTNANGSGIVQFNATYSYEFDSSNRVIRQTTTQDNGITIIRTATYY